MSSRLLLSQTEVQRRPRRRRAALTAGVGADDLLHGISAFPLVGSGWFVDGGLSGPPLHSFAPEISDVVSVVVTVR